MLNQPSSSLIQERNASEIACSSGGVAIPESSSCVVRADCRMRSVHIPPQYFRSCGFAKHQVLEDDVMSVNLSHYLVAFLGASFRLPTMATAPTWVAPSERFTVCGWLTGQ